MTESTELTPLLGALGVTPPAPGVDMPPPGCAPDARDWPPQVVITEAPGGRGGVDVTVYDLTDPEKPRWVEAYLCASLRRALVVVASVLSRAEPPRPRALSRPLR